MPVIKYAGPDSYSGSDPETGLEFTLYPGDEVEVSDAKAQQVQEDFPEWFGGGKKKSESKAEQPKKEDTT